MITRSTIVTAAVAAAAALAATGITYASAATSEPASAAAPAIQQAAPASALGGGDVGKGNEGGKGGGNERGGHDEGGRGHYEGRVHINERTYTDDAGGCVTVVSGLGSRTLNIRNDSRRTIEVFRGVTCDNGAPIATVGPHSTSNGVRPGHVRGGVHVENGVVGSFRVIERHFDDEGGRNW
ncbi:hypothetical protein AADR41_24005 [Streptomyces sp. CLV115]|uniref:hypothetical protein n=1 Tax=Streptomyces sp. CLV115 TaxID=3138502 RepID=UPI00313B9682